MDQKSLKQSISILEERLQLVEKRLQELRTEARLQVVEKQLQGIHKYLHTMTRLYTVSFEENLGNEVFGPRKRKTRTQETSKSLTEPPVTKIPIRPGFILNGENSNDPISPDSGSDFEIF